MPTIKYIKKEFDNLLIVSTLAKIAYQNFDALSEEETYILQALKRANPELENQTTEEISEHLQDLDETQLLGLSNNVKGILHEIQFVEMENNDGDSVTAAMFGDTNHQNTDILLTDNNTGEVTEIQLKATDNPSYVQDWIDNHPEGEILVTEELAEKMNLETSGISNEELTTDVHDFLDKLIELDENDELWDYIPTLPAISIAVSSFYLFKLYRDNKISFNTLKIKFIKLTGMKVAKFTIIAGLMMIPVINVIVGAGILFKLLYGAGTLANKYVP
ncbi:hypothetical protein [Seonamhaeicola aphaedonensis]|uniref:Uncharacterized protein n=1 Tax=Seonamhaeicola aphaedonensis TaxID=1461338 RepID=A0A3D9HH67_9FLAO|nr:hypothetical protein [Seonamhaeicola aphaedonensis]RED48803.1 hypothetical protein DFQ02_103133 [Seonamhaeicola aphaedonensis]